MSESTKSLRENVLKMVDGVLLQVDFLDVVNNCFNSEEAKKRLNKHYDGFVEYINEMHKFVPNEQKEQANAAYEAISSRESFVNKVLSTLKVRLALDFLKVVLVLDDELFSKVVSDVKEDFKRLFLDLLDEVALDEVNNMLDEYAKNAYFGYVPEGIPEEARDFLQFLIQLSGGVSIPSDLLFAGINDDEDE